MSAGGASLEIQQVTPSRSTQASRPKALAETTGVLAPALTREGIEVAGAAVCTDYSGRVQLKQFRLEERQIPDLAAGNNK